MWYNIYIKEREVTTMPHQFQCIVYLADGLHVSQVEPCETASEAMERAAAWTRLGHKAEAYLMVVDCEKGEIYHYPLN